MNKRLLGIPLLGLLVGLGSYIFSANNSYQVASAAMTIDDNRIITGGDIEDVKDITQVFLVLKDHSIGVGANITNYRATKYSDLTPFNLIKDENGTSIYSEDLGGYLKLENSIASGNTVLFNSSSRTYVDINDDGQISFTSNDVTYYLGYLKTSKLGFCTADNIYGKSINNYIHMFALTSDDRAGDMTSRYAYSLINDLGCDNNGVTPPSVSSWNSIRDNFTDSDFRNSLKDIESDKDSPIFINRALAKYDYIIGKYKNTFENYLSRSVIEINADKYVGVLSTITNMDNSGPIIISIISILSITSFGLYLAFRKK